MGEYVLEDMYKIENKFKENPLNLEVKQGLVTWVTLASSQFQQQCCESCLYNHNTANAVFTGLPFLDSISTPSKEKLIIATEQNVYKL